MVLGAGRVGQSGQRETDRDKQNTINPKDHTHHPPVRDRDDIECAYVRHGKTGIY